MSKPRWKRIDELSLEEEGDLRRLADDTPGLTYYGNRARTAVMLPYHIAKKVADLASEREQSIGQVIVDLLMIEFPDKS